MNSLVNRQDLFRDLESIRRDTMYREEFRNGYLHCWGICSRIVAKAAAVNPVEAAGGCYCWGCAHFRKDVGLCMRGDTPTLTTPQDFCSHGQRKTKEETSNALVNAV